MSWYQTKTCRMVSMLSLTFSFFLCEIVFGYITNSLALIGDSYHMLSDVIALGVGLASLRVSKKNSDSNTYGWARAEVVGALVNAVFLVALCFTIFIEAIQRLTHSHKIDKVDSMIIVGVVGLVVNVVGIVLFYNYGQVQSSEEDSASELEEQTQQPERAPSTESSESTETADQNDESSVSSQNTTSSFTISFADGDPVLASVTPCKPFSDINLSQQKASDDIDMEANKRKKIKSAAQLNMRAVFLHVLGDALGSVVVIISAIVIKFIDADWKYKIDPVLSMVLICIIMCTTVPLLKESALILMQTVPTHIDVANIKKKILEMVDGVYNVHELHIWQLAGSRIIATAHIRCRSLHEYHRIAQEVKSIFHNEGIHSTVVQPEFIEPESRTCAYECGPDKPCYADTCCARRNNITDPTSELADAGFRHSSKRIASWLELNESQTTYYRQFTDTVRGLIGHKRAHQPAQNPVSLDPSSNLPDDGFRHSSKRVPSWLELRY